MAENRFAKLSELKITTQLKNDKTVIADQFFTPPFKIMKPFYNNKGNATIIVLSSSAGFMSGDCQNVVVDVGKDTDLTVQSQSYEKIHKMDDGFASRKATINIDDNAFLNWSWLPVIPFAESNFIGTTDVTMSESSKLIITEVLSCGRSERGEKFQYKNYKNLTTVKRNGKLVYRDNVMFVPSKMDMNNYGMFENHTHILNVTAFGFNDAIEIKKSVNAFFMDNDIDGGISLTSYGDIAIRTFGKSGDILYKLAQKIVNIIKKEE